MPAPPPPPAHASTSTCVAFVGTVYVCTAAPVYAYTTSPRHSDALDMPAAYAADPAGHATGAVDPAGQYDPAGHDTTPAAPPPNTPLISNPATSG